jgi:hypothetical protein
MEAVSILRTSVSGYGGTLLYNAAPTGVKGRLNFAQQNVNQNHIITLVDSTPFTTQSTATYRPPFSANDTYIGLDNANSTQLIQAQLAFGAPISISEATRVLRTLRQLPEH